MPPLVVFDLRPLQCGYKNRGIGRYTRELLKALRARLAENPARYRLAGLGFRGEPSPEDIPLAIEAPRGERVWIWDQWVLPWRLRRLEAGLFHGCAALGPLKEVNIPVPFLRHSLVTVHDWHLWADDADALERFYRGTRRLRFQKRFLRRAARVIVDADCIAGETRARAGVPAERISVIAPGGDHLDAVPEKAVSESGFVLSLGDGPHKGLDLAYQAMAQARGCGCNLDWIVVGDRKRATDHMGISGAPPAWIRIVPEADDATIKGLYRSALCLLFPSRREGFGFPALEAMRLGCPVLAADVEPVRGLVANPEALSPPSPDALAAQLTRLARQPDFRAALIARGLDRAGDFTWQKTADQVLALWDDLLRHG